ncbi:toxin-antitoxin system HicB family antitoxin [Methylobacterium sp. J-078]|uniref:toxin-antitoxin system HicB family antitoxin n=1 Tax=Methylobacterium sp. J-078 TaxID=2836657 RepID=UPI00391D70B2
MRPLVYSDTITIRTDADLRAAIAAAAEREGASASDWVRRALASVTSGSMPSASSARRHHQPAQAAR